MCLDEWVFFTTYSQSELAATHDIPLEQTLFWYVRNCLSFLRVIILQLEL